jgi:hypothetical protein
MAGPEQSDLGMMIDEGGQAVGEAAKGTVSQIGNVAKEAMSQEPSEQDKQAAEDRAALQETREREQKEQEREMEHERGGRE